MYFFACVHMHHIVSAYINKSQVSILFEKKKHAAKISYYYITSFQRYQLFRGKPLHRWFAGYYSMHAGSDQPGDLNRVAPRRIHVQILFLSAG